MRRCTSSPTEFLRSDELPGDAAIGYLAVDRPRTNVFHLPVLGSGDGGIYTTVADVHALWAALDAGLLIDGSRHLPCVGDRRSDAPRSMSLSASNSSYDPHLGVEGSAVRGGPRTAG
jgi:hypothetical protein